MRKILLFLGLTFGLAAYAQKPNIAPGATVTADGAGGGGCRTGACSTLNDLNFGTCGTQEMWISTTPPNPVGVDYIEWNWPIMQSFDEMTIHHGNSSSRSLTGFLMQYWDGISWVNGESFTNLPQQCINTVTFQRVTTNRMRITSFEMTAPGQQSNPNFREIEIFQASTSDNDAGITSSNPVPAVCPGSYPVEVTVQNFGLNRIDSVQIHWEMDGVSQPMVMYSSQLDTIGGTGFSSALVNLGSYTFAPNQTYTLRAWTALPNNAADTSNFNDTLVLQVALGAPTGLAATNITATTADISWTSIAGTSYGFIYGPLGFNPNTGGTTVLPATSGYTITGLNPTSVYDVYLFADCGGSVYSDTAGPVTFSTLIRGPQGVNCDTASSTVVLLEEFDVQGDWTGDIGTGSTTGMWNFNSGATGSSNTGPSGAHSGSNYIYFEASGAGPASLISPAIDLTNATDSAELSFWMHAYGADIGYLLIRVSTTSATGPFTDTVFFYNQGQLQTSSSDPWQHVGVRLDQYVGQPIWLEFEADRTTSFSGDLSLDLVKVEACGDFCFPPFIVDSIYASVDSAQIFVDSTSNTYMYEWGPCGFSQGTGSATAGTGPVTLTGLTSNTCYDVLISQDCGSSGISLTRRYSFRTGCGVYTAPYFEDFDDNPANIVPYCWNSLITGGRTTAGVVETYTFATPRSTPNHIRFYNGSPATSADTTLFISPTFTDLTAGDKRITFYAQASAGVNSLIVGSIADPTDVLSFTAMDTVNIDNIYSIYKVDFTTANGYNSSDNHIAFRHGNGATFTTIYIDDFMYEQMPACNPPFINTLGASAIGSTDATIFWDPGTMGDETHIEVGVTGFTPGTGTSIVSDSVAGTIDSYNVTGLVPQSSYEFYIRDSCSVNGYSPWVGPYSFTTACSPFLAPYIENFDGSTWVTGSSGGSGDAIDFCWGRNSETGYKWAVYDATTASTNTGPDQDHTGGNYLYTESSSTSPATAELVSPLIDVTNLNTPYLTFYYHRFGSVANMGDLDVDVNDGSGWVNVLTLTGVDQTSGTDPFKDKGVDLSSFGDTLQVRFVATAISCCSGDMAIDLFEVKEAPSCPDIIGLNAGSVTDSSVSLTWVPGSGNPNYEIWIGPQGFFQGTATVGGSRSITTNDSVYTDTLSPNTCYEYLVRAICAPGDTSDWSGPVSFCTPCVAFNAPYQETFDIWPLSCWDLNGGSQSWSNYPGPGIDQYAFANFWSWSTGEAYMTSPVINLNAKPAEVVFDWSHLYNSTYPDDQILVIVKKVGTSLLDTIIDLKGSNFDDPSAASTSPGNFITETIPLDSATYANSSIQVLFLAVSDFGPDAYINNFKVWYPVSDDVALLNGDFSKNGRCLSNNDTVVLQVQNILGSTINFATTPLVANYTVTGPVNSSGTITLNTGTLAVMDTTEMTATNVDLSQPGLYTLNAFINPNASNLNALNDTLLISSTIQVYPVWEVTPDSVVVITNMTDTVELKAESPFFGGDKFFITEQCHFKTTSGAPTAGWPSYLTADDYIEITGVPNSDLGGYTLEQWSTSALTSTHTFPQGTLLSPNGTAIIMIGAGGKPSEPANFLYDGRGSSSPSFGSTGTAGRIIKNPQGVIVDAVSYSGSSSYTFPAAAGVTAADWSGNPPTSGSTSGIRLEGPDLNSSTGWVASATSPQDPNVLNVNVPLPAPSSTAGFAWTLNGNTIDTMPTTVVGPYNSSGVYNYIATFNGPCGVFSDTVQVVVNLPGSCPIPANLTGVAVACDSILISWNNAADSSLVAFAPTGSTPTSANLVIGDSSFAAVGVTPSTSYDFYVANICGSDTSFMAGPFTINSGTAGAPVANFTANSPAFNTTVEFDASPSFGARATYTWDFGDGNTGTGRDTIHTYAAGGSYNVTLTVTNACGTHDTTITLADVSIGENPIAQSLVVYPNPTSDAVNISFDNAGNGEVTIRILDLSGKEVMQVEGSSRGDAYSGRIHIGNLADGVYMLEISSGGMKANRRLIKQ